MIDRFNFYDIYGYFIPGITLLALLWLPYAMAVSGGSGVGWLSALLSIPLAYVVGQLLQIRARYVFTSKVRDWNDKLRYPSEICLDKDNPDKERYPSVPDRETVVKQIAVSFGIDVDRDSNKRLDVWFLCRSVLMQNKVVNYGEQFEGLSSLMRGLTVAFLLAFAYYAGWTWAALLKKASSAVPMSAFDICLIGGLGGATCLSLPWSNSLDLLAVVDCGSFYGGFLRGS